MRVGIISDIHANLPALEAVIKDMENENIHHIICLGDIIGYGPFPEECLKRVRDVTSYVIMGNHEAAAAGLFDVNLFHDEAKEHILWTRDQLSQEELSYIKNLHYMLDFDDFLVIHGGLPDPDYFPYIETEEEARATFAETDSRLIFVGHTHLPLIHRISHHDEYITVSKEEVRLNPKWRYIVNPGAVGLSRDAVFSAGYSIYDSDLHKVFFKRVRYSLKPLYDAIREMAKSPEHLNVLMERFRPPNTLNIKKASPNKISKSALQEAAERYKKMYNHQ